ncbi:MAG: hypothetical protein M0R06_11670 [Sphaerochaeta sp.]|jgi:hypothetical protein|nr:hypothetical protein [Sphaerochaeta sp.]
MPDTQVRADIIINGTDNASATLAKVKKSMDSVNQSVASSSQKLTLLDKDLGKIPSSAKWVAAAVAAATVLAIRDVSKAYIEQERAIARLYQLTRQTTDATNEQVEALIDQANALQKVGVVGDEVIQFGQSQLATFALTTGAIAKLTPSMLDLAVAVNGVNVTQESMMNIGNLVGKAMTGQSSMLARYGVVVSDAQQEQLRLGTEMERAAILTEILENNFGGLNEATRDTFEGRMAAAKNRVGDIKEEIGKGLVPVLANAYDGVADVSEALFGTEDASYVAFQAFRGVAEYAVAMTNAVVKSFAAIGALTAQVMSLPQTLGDKAFGWIDRLIGVPDYTAKHQAELNAELAEFGRWAEGADETLENFVYRNIEAEEKLRRTARAAGGAGAGGMNDLTEGTEAASSALKSLVGEFKSLEKKMEDLAKRRRELEIEEATEGLDARQKAAALYVEQERKVLEMTEAINKAEAEGATMRELNEMRAERNIAAEQLRKTGTIPASYQSDVAEARRRAGLSDYERAIEDLQISETQRRIEASGEMGAVVAEEKQAKQTVINFNFNGDVNDKDALKREIIDAINRQFALAAT